MAKLIIGNWKMNKGPAETKAFIKELIKALGKPKNVAVCPPSISLPAAAEALKGSTIMLCAQNMHHEESGAFTGEVSPLMLKELGVTHVLLGHSERREFFLENDELINLKVKSALSHGLTPVLCIGELLEQKKKGKTKEVLRQQLRIGLGGIPDLHKVILAYEPVWAISRGDPNHPAASAEDAQGAHAFIRSELASLYGAKAAKEACLIYGGSVKPENVMELMAQKDIDGGLPGNASLDAKKFALIVQGTTT
ncbi:MAG: triose-phosphate isomerase [Nanoarchaeota archaeon]